MDGSGRLNATAQLGAGLELESSLGERHFFYVGQDNYDDIAERSLPHYVEGHRAMAAILRQMAPHAQDALDLGTGSGFTAQMVLEALPAVRVAGVDLFDSMLSHARARLQPFGSRVALTVSDNTAWLRANVGRKFDVVTSAFCIHHLDANGKRELFGLIAAALRPGSLFLMLDLTTFAHPAVRQLARDTTQTYMLANVADESTRKEWLHHWNFINIPDPADDMVAWLRQAGLQAETVCRWWEVALILAVAKP